jgi:hypothetical protein
LEFTVMFLRTFAIAAATATFALAGLAQAPAGHAGHHPPAAASAAGMGKSAMKGKAPSMAVRQAMLEKRMDMMQSMMMDQMQQNAPRAVPGAAK